MQAQLDNLRAKLAAHEQEASDLTRRWTTSMISRVKSLHNMPRFGSLSSGKRAKSLGAKTHQRSVSDSSLREVVQECRLEDTREYSNSDTEVTTTDTEPTILYRD